VDDWAVFLSSQCCSQDTGHDDSSMVNRNILDRDEIIHRDMMKTGETT
jgi:hypothetical protein